MNKYLEELDIASLKAPAVPVNRATCDQRRWIAPSLGGMKINVDAEVSRHVDHGVVAAICRDETGRYTGASAVIHKGLTDGSYGSLK